MTAIGSASCWALPFSDFSSSKSFWKRVRFLLSSKRRVSVLYAANSYLADWNHAWSTAVTTPLTAFNATTMGRTGPLAQVVELFFGLKQTSLNFVQGFMGINFFCDENQCYFFVCRMHCLLGLLEQQWRFLQLQLLFYFQIERFMTYGYQYTAQNKEAFITVESIGECPVQEKLKLQRWTSSHSLLQSNLHICQEI